MSWCILCHGPADDFHSHVWDASGNPLPVLAASGVEVRLIGYGRNLTRVVKTWNTPKGAR